jgi:hypothetical protein
MGYGLRVMGLSLAFESLHQTVSSILKNALIALK